MRSLGWARGKISAAPILGSYHRHFSVACHLSWRIRSSSLMDLDGTNGIRMDHTDYNMYEEYVMSSIVRHL